MNTMVSEEAATKAGEDVIEALAGKGASLREDQKQAILAVTSGQRCLVVQATGWGKSAVYWAATKAIRENGGGVSIIVSPLLALMNDQVRAGRKAGLRVETLNSENIDNWAEIEGRLEKGEVDALLISPERLATLRFKEIFEQIEPGLVVIDEAHCISTWGHDFRPDYQRIAGELLERAGAVLATTATATDQVAEDVRRQLGEGTLLLRGKLGRDSLSLNVVSGLSGVEQYAWLDEALTRLDGSGIIYVPTTGTAARVTGWLNSRGHQVAAYTGKTPQDEKQEAERNLRENKIKAVVATSALGMGYDKPDIAFCLHLGSPGGAVDYYQQIGRAGRMLESAVVALLPTTADEDIWEWMATSSLPRKEETEAILTALEAVPKSVVGIETATGIRRSRIELTLKMLAVEGAAVKGEEGWEKGGPWEFDKGKYDKLADLRRSQAQVMREYARGGDCLEKLLLSALGEEVPNCGKCSTCTGLNPALPDDVTEEKTRAAASWLRASKTVLPVRKMWPSGMKDKKGRIGAAIGEGRAVGVEGEAGWEDLESLQGDAPQWLIDETIAVLARWKEEWPSRPTAVMPLGDDELSAKLGAKIAEAGKLRLLAPAKIGKTGNRISAAQKARDLEGSAGVAENIDGEVILLVSRRWVSGWSSTICAEELSEKGAALVLPLAVSLGFE